MGPSAPSSFDHRGETEAQRGSLLPVYWLRFRPKVIAPFLPDSVSPPRDCLLWVWEGRGGPGRAPRASWRCRSARREPRAKLAAPHPALQCHRRAPHSPDYLYDPPNSGKQALPLIQLLCAASVCSSEPTGGEGRLVQPARVPRWAVMDPTTRRLSDSPFSPELQGGTAETGGSLGSPAARSLGCGADSAVTPYTSPARGHPAPSTGGKVRAGGRGQGRGPGPGVRSPAL